MIMNVTIQPQRFMRAMVGVVLVTALAGCSARGLQDDARLDFNAGRMEQGIAKLEAATNRDPANLVLRADLQRWKHAWVDNLLTAADAAGRSSRWREAESGYRQVLGLDEDNAGARHGLELVEQAHQRDNAVRAAKELIAQGDLAAAHTRLRQVVTVDQSHSEANKLLAEIEERQAREAGDKTNGKSRQEKPINLEFRDAKLSLVFEALSRASGINFVVDKDVKADTKTTIYLKDLSVNSALDLLVVQQALRRKVLTDNTILVYPNTPEKRKLYDDQIVKTFYLTHAEPKQAMNLLKTMLDSKVLFMDEKARLVVMRDSPEAVRMAEKLMGSLDMPEAEVMLEVEVIEIQRSKLTELGIKYPTQFTLSAGAAAGFTLDSLLSLTKDQILATPLSATANFRREVTAADILASPRIRARSREKAKILIGDRVPVITNSVTPTVGQPVVTGQVQYIEVGLKLDVEPVIYRDNDVAIKLTLEVSSIVREISGANGSLAYQIGTRTASTLLQLKDGETQVLAGLITDDERQASNRIPGLGDLPVIGRLFSTQRDEKKKSELVLSITPHVVRAVPHADPRLAEFTFGSDSVRGSSLALKSSDDSKGSLYPQPQVGEPSPVTPPAMAPARPYAPPDLNSPPATLDPSTPAPKNEPVPQEQPDAAGTDSGLP
jgi:general secretion pathway protein D